jgi:hypothetical protein
MPQCILFQDVHELPSQELVQTALRRNSDVILASVEARVRPVAGPNWTVMLMGAHRESLSVTYTRYIALLIDAVLVARLKSQARCSHIVPVRHFP